MTRGRPRDAAADERILDAARTLLVRDGYAAVSIAAVAAAAGVARTTVYRRWPARQHLVLDVVAALQAAVPVPDTGDWRADVRALALAVAGGLRAIGPAMVADLAAASASDPALADGVHTLWTSRKRVVVERVATAVPAAAAELLVDQVFGALYYRVLVTGEHVPDAYVAALVDSVLATVPDPGSPS